MYRRLVILSAIIFAALAGLVWLGYRSLDMQAQGMAGARLGEFAAVAEQIRKDVKRNLDEFMQTEQNRPYTDYQPYYVPESVLPNQQQSRLPSPLGGRLDNGLAYGSFQIEPPRHSLTILRKPLDRCAPCGIQPLKRPGPPCSRPDKGLFVVRKIL